MDFFVTTVNGWKPSTIDTKSFVLDVASVLHTPLNCSGVYKKKASIVNSSSVVLIFNGNSPYGPVPNIQKTAYFHCFDIRKREKTGHLFSESQRECVGGKKTITY